MFKISVIICGLIFVGVQSASIKKTVINDEVTRNMVESHGYTVEEHTVQTSDGYIIEIFRIPNPGKEVVYLQHGHASSHLDWLVTGPGLSLAYILHDAGYDVWLGNNRGNRYGRRHQYLSPDSKEFWNFSWHEIGQLDLPAIINFILRNTNQPALHYVGHSQGTTIFFVMASLRKDLNPKIKSMQALSPIAFMTHAISPFVRGIAPYIHNVEWTYQMLGKYEMDPNSAFNVGLRDLCKTQSMFVEVCANQLFLLGGFNSEQLNRTMLPAIMQNVPAGASVLQSIHSAQLFLSFRFRMFDHLYYGNLLKYGQALPPDYDLGAISVPVHLHYSENDWLSAVKDVETLTTKLGNFRGKHLVPDRKFSHFDYLWAINVKSLVYDKVIDIIRMYQ